MLLVAEHRYRLLIRGKLPEDESFVRADVLFANSSIHNSVPDPSNSSEYRLALLHDGQLSRVENKPWPWCAWAAAY